MHSVSSLQMKGIELLGQQTDHLIPAGTYAQQDLTEEEAAFGPTLGLMDEQMSSVFELMELFHVNAFKWVLTNILSLYTPQEYKVRRKGHALSESPGSCSDCLLYELKPDERVLIMRI